MVNNTKLSAPWDIYFSKMNALFGKDTELTLNFNRDNYTINIYTPNGDKGDALRQILPESVPMGNITLTINVNVVDALTSPADLYNRAFKGNPVFVRTETYQLPDSENAYFAEFWDGAAVYYADDLTNPNGLQFALYQDIAREILKNNDIFITSIDHNAVD